MTLLDQQQVALVGLVASLMEDVGVTRPLIAEMIANLDASNHVINGRYAIRLSFVREFVNGLASWVDSIIDEANEGQRNELFNDIASVLSPPVVVSSSCLPIAIKTTTYLSYKA
ncbi:unnamed protein product [Sphagnum troendelagicum]|uniref:Uncharacterized protein n=1 Tax=Sphagnum troendelagicum TaxID=128251 RepID=A0ABP0TSE0_9BRYO